MIGILIVAHAPIASALGTVTEHVFKSQPAHFECLDIEADSLFEDNLIRFKALTQKLDNGQGILCLTDICGATPANQCKNFIENHAPDTYIEMLYGVNLPMVLRSINYRHMPLSELVQKTDEGGRMSIFDCPHNKALSSNMTAMFDLFSLFSSNSNQGIEE